MNAYIYHNQCKHCGLFKYVFKNNVVCKKGEFKINPNIYPDQCKLQYYSGIKSRLKKNEIEIKRKNN